MRQEDSDMLDLDRHEADRDLQRAERFLLVLLTLIGMLVAVYALGASGLPGNAFGAALDWAISRGVVDATTPIVQLAAAML